MNFFIVRRIKHAVVVGWPWLVAKPLPSLLLTPSQQDGGEHRMGKSEKSQVETKVV